MTDTDLREFVRGLPKAELHVHIEGTLEPELLLSLAERNQVELGYSDVDSLRAAYEFTDLQSFLDIYYRGAGVLQTERDFFDLMTSYLVRAHRDGVRRAEIFFDPQTHLERGVSFDVFMPGLLGAIDAAEAELGISAGLIMCFLRHLPASSALATFRDAAPYLISLLGVGLDSAELDHPPEEFVEVFRLAGDSRLHRVAHAGEEGPASYITGALDALHAERIDHGVRCEDDPDVVNRLIEAQIALTMCPLSNVALHVVEQLADHNLKRLMAQGVNVTINSDDPAYFGGYVADNYVACATALGLSRPELTQLARNSIEASFAPAAELAVWLAELEAYVSDAI